MTRAWRFTSSGSKTPKHLKLPSCLYLFAAQRTDMTATVPQLLFTPPTRWLLWVLVGAIHVKFHHCCREESKTGLSCPKALQD